MQDEKILVIVCNKELCQQEIFGQKCALANSDEVLMQKKRSYSPTETIVKEWGFGPLKLGDVNISHCQDTESTHNGTFCFFHLINIKFLNDATITNYPPLPLKMPFLASSATISSPITSQSHKIRHRTSTKKNQNPLITAKTIQLHHNHISVIISMLIQTEF